MNDDTPTTDPTATPREEDRRSLRPEERVRGATVLAQRLQSD
jgi:hypothetical protein